MNNSLAEVHPELVSEWSEKNLTLTPDNITFGSNKKVWWRSACSHEWQASVKARSNGEKCPICSGARVIAGINDLATLEPLLVKQWSKKNKIKPTEVSIGSHKKVIWRCEKGHEWEAAVKSRTINKTGCPYCSHILGEEFGLKKPSMVLLEQIRTVNREDLREYIGTVDDDKLFRQINATLKKTFGLWVYKPEGKENIRCLCPKCLNDYIHNPDYIVRRLDPFAKRKDRCDKCEAKLFKLFGVNAELIIDRAWGWEPTTIADIKAYKPSSNSLSVGQVLKCPYNYEKTKLIVREMIDQHVLDLVDKGLVTDQIVLDIGYDIENPTDPKISARYHGDVTTDRYGRKVRAISFYKREGFEIQHSGLDEATGEKDYVMTWQHK